MEARAAFSRCSQDECDPVIRQECASSRDALEGAKDAEARSARVYVPGPNMAAALRLKSRQERVVEHARRLKIATYGVTAAGLALGGWALASGLRGHEIDNRCASDESCSPSTAAHGRMLYRSADAGAALAAACGVSAAILLYRWFTVSSSDDWRSASTLQFTF